MNNISKLGGLPKYFNPYNQAEIIDVAPTLTCHCGSWQSSSAILILEESEKVLASSKASTRLSAKNPYGDGTSSKQIEEIIRAYFNI